MNTYSKFFLLTLSLIFIFKVSAKEPPLEAFLKTENLTGKVNDVHVKVSATGGKAPYLYIWNQRDVSVYTNEVELLPEGELISVIVVDSNKDSVTVESHIKCESFEERIGELMAPAVSFLNTVLFKNIWSDTVKVRQTSLKAPAATIDNIESYTIKEWLVNDGDNVSHMQPVAILQKDTQEFPFYAIGTGKINFETYDDKKVQEGDEVHLLNERGNKTGKVLATISYSEPQPFYYPNLSKRTQGIPLIVAWLVLGAMFFTFRLNFLQFNPKTIKHSINLIRGKFDPPTPGKGDVTHFQALVTALSATIGLGNIAGVAIAISLGGPGATFWMILAGLLGMVVKFSEASLGVKYRTLNQEGEVSGGPMYYLSRGLAKRGNGMKKLGKVLAFSFAVLSVVGSFGIGNMFQANQAFNQISGTPGLEGIETYGFLFGIILAILVGLVIVGGIKSIARVTDKIVPLMVAIYLVASISIIVINYNNLGAGFGAIFNGAFNPEAMYGGVIGVLIVGFQRAAFSNEAGIGSSPIAHAAAQTEDPVSEGVVALLEPFIDTVVVCTMTALVIIFSGYAFDNEGLEGAALTSAAFSSVLGEWAIYVLSFSVFLFAFSTMISWSYYGKKSFSYLFGETKTTGLIYNSIFLIFIVIGTSIGLGAVLDFSDLLILAMAFPNVLGLIIMSGEVKRDTKEYFKRLKSGQISKYR